MKESNEKLNKMMEELGNLMKTISPLMMEALGEVESNETEFMAMMTSTMRLIKQFDGYVKSCIDESEENEKRMKRLEEKIDRIVEKSDDTNSVVRTTNNLVYGIKESAAVLVKRSTEE